MFGDAEHYKYLTNEADLNNANDDSIALTPKTPKKVSIPPPNSNQSINVQYLNTSTHCFKGRSQISVGKSYNACRTSSSDNNSGCQASCDRSKQD